MSENTVRMYVKQRRLWHPSALRLMREEPCARYARATVPNCVDGMQIRFPAVETRYGMRLLVQTPQITGEPLTEILARAESQLRAVEYGLTAVTALQHASVTRYQFAGFGALFRIAKGLKIALLGTVASPRLCRPEYAEFMRLMGRYLRKRPTTPVLVHGDLQQTHILVDEKKNSIGFIDLEAMHVGKAATNFAQLWIGYHYTAEEVGSHFYRLYCERFPERITPQFDNDVRFEIALRAFVHVRAGRNQTNGLLETYADKLLHNALSGATFATFQGGKSV